MRYAALLRGINVGGHKKVPMAELRALLGELGYADVATFLQSGNAVFSSDQVPAALERDIAAAVAGKLKVDCQVLVRTGEELAAAAGGSPLAEPENPSRYFVAFLSAEPAPEKVAELTEVSFGADKLWVRGREAYLWCANGAADTKLTGSLLERRLGVVATARNWNTVTKLTSLTAG
jgi:uncharacterized protein (DUF1697 family)